MSPPCRHEVAIRLSICSRVDDLERAIPRRAGAHRPAAGRASRRAGGRAGGADQGRGACEPGRRAAAAGRKDGGMIQSVETRLDGNNCSSCGSRCASNAGAVASALSPRTAASLRPRQSRSRTVTLVKAAGACAPLAANAGERRVRDARRACGCGADQPVVRLPHPASDAPRARYRRADPRRPADGRARAILAAVSGRVAAAARAVGKKRRAMSAAVDQRREDGAAASVSGGVIAGRRQARPRPPCKRRLRPSSHHPRADRRRSADGPMRAG